MMEALKNQKIVKIVSKQFSSNKVLSAGASGLVVTLSLFYLMSQLISGGQSLNKSDDSENFIEFVRVKRDSTIQERKRQLPKKPPEPKKPPPPQKMSVAADQPNKPQMKMNLPKLSTSLKEMDLILDQAVAAVEVA